MTNYTRARGTAASSNLMGDGFRARINKGGASLCMLHGRGGVRIYIAGFKKHVISMVIPSGRKIVHSMMLNFSSVRSCVDGPSSFNTDVNHCTGHVGRKGFALSKIRCRLPHGGCKRYLRNNPGKFRCRMCSTGRIKPRRLRLACLSGSNRRNFPNGVAYGIVVGLASSGTVSVGCRTRASGPAVIGVAGRSCFGLSKSTNDGTSRLLAVSTSTCAPISDAFVADNRVMAIRNAPVSFHAPAPIKGHVGSFSFIRLGGNGNCSRG